MGLALHTQSDLAHDTGICYISVVYLWVCASEIVTDGVLSDTNI